MQCTAINSTTTGFSMVSVTYAPFRSTAPLIASTTMKHVRLFLFLVELGSPVLECRSHNRESPGSNPPFVSVSKFMHFRSLQEASVHSAVYMSTELYKNIPFTFYSSRRRIAHVHGDTNTASALRFARTQMFTEKNGARRGIPHIVIVITDGKSNNPQITQQEAAKAQAQGIYMFAIGVGANADQSELHALASDPDDHYLFTVDDYTALLFIEDIVAIKTCEGQSVLDDSVLPCGVNALLSLYSMYT